MMEKRTIRKHRRRLFLFFVLLLLVMLIIFLMSAKDGSNSSQMSGRFADSVLGNLLMRVLPRLTDNEITSLRKYAHIFEFFCLGISSFLFFNELFWLNRRRLAQAGGFAVLWSFLYACSDEWHQTFVPARSGQLSDLRFDAAGFLMGIALTCLIAWLIGKKGENTGA